MITIQNTDISATINPKGAELKSLLHLSTKTDYMWPADPAYWGKTSPVLFPIVGELRNNTFKYQGKEYHLPRHGFARDRVFEVESQTDNSVTFLLKDDAQTINIYPFHFEFRLHYSVEGSALKVQYEVLNAGTETMIFSVGGHPAFKVPLELGTSYHDYYLEFNRTEDLMRWPLAAGGLIGMDPEKLSTDKGKLWLTKELFYQDALVFKHLLSDAVTLKSDKTSHQLKFHFKGFPFLGIWAAKDADFVCIEPWCGIADSVAHDGQLTEKEGVIALNPEQRFNKTWIAEIGY